MTTMRVLALVGGTEGVQGAIGPITSPFPTYLERAVCNRHSLAFSPLFPERNPRRGDLLQKRRKVVWHLVHL